MIKDRIWKYRKGYNIPNIPKMFPVYAILFSPELLVIDCYYILLCILQTFVPPLKNSKKCFTLENSSTALVNLEKCWLGEQLERNFVDVMGNARVSTINESTDKLANVNFTSNSTEYNIQNASVEYNQISNINSCMDVASLKLKPIVGKKYENDYACSFGTTKAGAECKGKSSTGESVDQKNVNLSHELSPAIVYGDFEIQFSPLSAFSDNETGTEFAKDINTENDYVITKAVDSISNKEIKQCNSSQDKFISSPFRRDSAINNFNTDYSKVLCNLTFTDSVAETENSEIDMPVYERCPKDDTNKDFPKFTEQIENMKNLQESKPNADDSKARSSFTGSLNENNNEPLPLFFSNIENGFRKKVFFCGKDVAWNMKEFPSANIIDPKLHTRRTYKSHILSKDTYHNLSCVKTQKSQELHFDEHVYENNQIFEIITENSNISNNFNNKNEGNGEDEYGKMLTRGNNLFEGSNLQSARDKLEISTSYVVAANQHYSVPSSRECFLNDNSQEFVDISLVNSKIPLENIIAELEKGILDEDTSRTLNSTKPKSLGNCDETADNMQYIHSDLKRYSLGHKIDGNEASGLLSLEYSEFSEPLFTKSSLIFQTHIKPSQVIAIAY